MSEMLGNQYFMGRKFSDAAIELEEVLIDQPHNKTALKKLIICYSQIGDLQKTLNTLFTLITEDIEFIIHTDVIEDDCPCPELVSKSEKLSELKPGDFNHFALQGTLWLYCNVQKSIDYFNKALKLDNTNELVRSILSLINNYVKKNGIPKPFDAELN